MSFNPLLSLARNAKRQKMDMQCDPQWVLDLAAERDHLREERDSLESECSRVTGQNARLHDQIVELYQDRDQLRAELIKANDRYQRDVYGLNNEGDPIGGEPPGGYANDNAKLRAELDAIRGQKPVAWQSRFTDEEWAKCSRGHFDWVKREPEAFPGGYEARELYALPPQQLGAEERDVPLHAAINRACGELPDGWSIEVNAERDGAWVALLNAELEVVEFPTNNERLDYTVNDAVEFAILSTRQAEEGE
ncbi:hypothetical protein [Pseudomonas sp. 2023EL-01195]|uniref:hypothetical protein n=1 Tax=Pseudomonas sp. 2023EL-01195 TaxID=3088134 RepID=UPI00296B0AB8|nr:hypothetical protein [Pseudomonas sp. 2023EL-01195]MDW3712894.1 hypothetical protein [Pseudomonas sp. 2023EL-01195]